MERIKVVLKSGKDQSLLRKHPWIFSGAIKKIYGNPAEGELIELYDNKDNFLALGHYQIGSIAVRVISFKNENIDSDFWNMKIYQSVSLRKETGLLDNSKTNVFRLINAEGDGMPGLIADFYNGIVVLQIHSIGMYINKEFICNALKDNLKEKLIAIYDKSSTTLPFKSKIKSEDGFLMGEESFANVLENENKYQIDFIGGQKTGFFIDQRDNRDLVRQMAENKKVANLFCYTGGFSLAALKGNAREVHSIDSSAKAIDLTDKNVSLNYPGCSKHKSYAVDAFEFLSAMDEDFDLIILDPPAFAKHQNVLHNALQGYKKLNQAAFKKIKSGGILFTFSCSQVVSKENFRKSVFAAAANSGRQVQILYQLTQPSDHPVSIFHPEGEYLKGLVLRVV